MSLVRGMGQGGRGRRREGDTGFSCREAKSRDPGWEEEGAIPSHRTSQRFLDFVALYSSLHAPPPPVFPAGQWSFPFRLLCREGLEAEVQGGGRELARALLSWTCRFSSRLSYTW